MADIEALADSVYRDYVTDGVSSSGANRPSKDDIRGLFAAIEGDLTPQSNLYIVEKHGIIGDGVADDTAAWQTLLNLVPNGSIIRVSDPAFIMQITSTLTMSDKEDVWIVSGRDARNFATSPVFRWAGANNGVMFDLDRCRSCHVEGFNFRTTNGITIDTFINIDGYSGGHISTLNVVRYNSFNASNQLNSAAKLVSISATAVNNNENMSVSENTFVVSNAVRPAAGGVGIYQGPSPNAKHNLYYQNGISQATTGIYIASGSCDIRHLGGGSSKTDIYVTAPTEPILVSHLETEGSGVAIHFDAAGGTLSMEVCRFSNGDQTAAGGFLKLDGLVNIESSGFEYRPPGGGTLIENNGTGNLRLKINSRYASGTTYAESGLDAFEALVGTDTVQSLVCGPNTLVGAPSRYFFQFNGTDPITADPVGWYFGSPVRLKPRTFASLTESGGILPTLGTIAVVSDSTTDVWGATITGGGALKVLAWFNDANWKVVGK